MIFLSASVPDPKRHDEYTMDGNINAIRDAVVAFTTVCAEWNIPFYFGGHPAISPLVYGIATKYIQQPQIKIYQSEFFRDKTPKEVNYFDNICWTPKVDNDISESIRIMRTQMFSDNFETPIAVFIGGMKGISDEAKMIKDMIPNVRLIPLASTGGASFDLYRKIGCTDKEYFNSYAYLSLFSNLLIEYRKK